MPTWLADKILVYIPAYIVAVLVIVVAIIFGLYWFARMVIKAWEFYTKTNTTNSTVSKLNDSFQDSFDKFKKDIKKDLRKMKTSMSELETQIREFLTPEEERLTATNSPVELTEVGYKLIENSGAKEIVDNEVNKTKILSVILEDPSPTNAYDAQQKTIEALRDLKDDAMFSSVKDFAFKNGKSIEDILYATAIYFRNYVLESLGFQVEDLDQKT